MAHNVPPTAADIFGTDGLAGEVRRANVALGIERPIIALRPGDCPEAVDSGERVLVAHAERLRLFQRAGELVRVISLEADHRTAGLIRQAGAVMLTPVGVVGLMELFDRLARWQRVRANKDGDEEAKPADCPVRVAAAYLSRAGAWKLPHLVGVIAAPIMRPDGSILAMPGYDAATGLYLTGDAWPVIPERPTRAQAEAALSILMEPFREFPFVAAEDWSVLMAAILTAVQRRLLPSAPLFGFTAPTQRTGKSALAEAVAIIATGRPAPAMAVSGDREEIRKAVAASLREGHAVMNLDNVEHPLGSPDLARAITQSEYADRLLGETRILRLPTNLTWTATGNNLAFRGDLAVRTLLCRLDAQLERPEERHFAIPDLARHLAEHRPRLVAAALTILSAYDAAGSPAQAVQPWGGFGVWSGSIRSALVWLGQADPCGTRQYVIADDPDREQAAALLVAWHRVFGARSVQTGEIVAAVDAELRAAVLGVAAGKDNPREADPRRPGWWCRGRANQIIGGLRLSRVKGGERVGLWRVAQPDPPDAGFAVSAVFSGPSKTNTSAETEKTISGDLEKTAKTAKPAPEAAGSAQKDCFGGAL